MTTKDEEKKENLKDLILEEARKGNVVFMSFEGPYKANLNAFVEQPAEGILYDLNRLGEVVLTFIEDPKWVNDFAVGLVIKKLKDNLSQLHIALDGAQREISKSLEWFAQYPFENKAFEANSATGRYHELDAWLRANPVKKTREEEFADEWRAEHPTSQTIQEEKTK